MFRVLLYAISYIMDMVKWILPEELEVYSQFVLKSCTQKVYTKNYGFYINLIFVTRMRDTLYCIELICLLYYKTKKSTSLRYFDTCFLHNIGRVSDKRWHDSLSTYYIDKKSCHRLSETPPILCMKHVSKQHCEAESLVL